MRASGATGRVVVGELLQRQQKVRIIVRSPRSLPAELVAHEDLSVTYASVLDLSDKELAQLLEGCEAVVSCLGRLSSCL
jgi:putative NADH-flavin reductase